MAEFDPPLYLFDEYALESGLAEGSPTVHASISNWENGTLCVTKSAKEKFLSAYPLESDPVSKFHVVRRKYIDHQIAASLSEQFQNLIDLDTREVQAKIFMIAVAMRLGATIVTSESIGLTTWIKALADQVGVQCITLDQFLE